MVLDATIGTHFAVAFSRRPRRYESRTVSNDPHLTNTSCHLLPVTMRKDSVSLGSSSVFSIGAIPTNTTLSFDPNLGALFMRRIPSSPRTSTQHGRAPLRTEKQLAFLWIPRASC
jgi:hypothetical protein